MSDDLERLNNIATHWESLTCCDFMYRGEVESGDMSLQDAVSANCEWLRRHSEYCVQQIERIAAGRD